MWAGKRRHVLKVRIDKVSDAVWASDAERSPMWNLALIWSSPLLPYPITLLGRRVLDIDADKHPAAWASIFTHYAMMIALGVGIFPRIRLVQERTGTLLIRNNSAKRLYG